MKKIILFPAAICSIVLLAGCGAQGTASSTATTVTAPTATTATVVATATAATSAGMISDVQAKQIALADAGLPETEVSWLSVKLDYDDGRAEYHVEFYQGTVEIDYEIDALTGAILSSERDTRETVTTSAGMISDERAKQIALADAGLPETEVSRLNVKLDYDDGRAEYHVEFYQGTVEIEYEIDAMTGAILSSERDTD